MASKRIRITSRFPDPEDVVEFLRELGFPVREVDESLPDRPSRRKAARPARSKLRKPVLRTGAIASLTPQERARLIDQEGH